MIVPESCIPLLKLQRSRKGNFWEKIQRDYEDIKTYLPKQIGNVLDIGCGLCGIDVLIHNNHEVGNFYLFDYDRTDKKVFFGFNKTGAAYNSFNEAKEMIHINICPEKTFFYKFVDAAKEKIPDTKYDLVISLLSCGYHYPIDIYLQDILNNLDRDGIFIFDSRNTETANALNMLRDKFLDITILPVDNKANKVICRGLRYE